MRLRLDLLNNALGAGTAGPGSGIGCGPTLTQGESLQPRGFVSAGPAGTAGTIENAEPVPTSDKVREAHALFCTVCGPIHAKEMPAAHAGYAYGMPIVTGCEWCQAGERPTSRPRVACATCRHFERVDPNKISGPGNCAAGAVPAGMAQRVATLTCGAWAPNRVARG